MIHIDIPTYGVFDIQHLVIDYNGTLALEGNLLPGVRELLIMLAPIVEIHVITAETFQLAHHRLYDLPVKLEIITQSEQADAKLDYVRRLGSGSVIAVGNGRNDRKMLEGAAIGIFVVQREGGSVRALSRADVITTSIVDALDLIRHPQRLVATLRS